MAIPHQGRNKPLIKAKIAVSMVAVRNFMLIELNC